MTKRERLDSAVDIEPLDTESSVRVIRSHRRHFEYRLSVKQAMSILIICLMCSPTLFIQASTINSHGKSTAPLTVAPYTFPPVPYVAPTLPQAEPSTDRTASARGSRDAPRAPEQPKPVNRVEIAVQFALAQQGDRYVWAAAGPNSYDCSGLVMRAFAQIGIKLPHYTGTMISHGARISRANMQRGDIVFPSSGHVGIYLGGGMMVHASSSKGRVVVAKVYAFYAARRVT